MAPSVAPHCPLHKSKLLPLALRPTRSSWCSCSSLSSSHARALSLSLSLLCSSSSSNSCSSCWVQSCHPLPCPRVQPPSCFLLSRNAGLPTPTSVYFPLTNPCSPRSPGEAVECGGYGLEPWGHATCCKCQCSWGEMTESLCGPGFLL